MLAIGASSNIAESWIVPHILLQLSVTVELGAEVRCVVEEPIHDTTHVIV